MSALLSVVLPVFALIGLGWGGRRLGLFGPTAAGELNRFVVWLGQPALLFGIMSRAQWSDYRLDFVIAMGGALVLTFLLVLAINFRRLGGGDATVDALSASYANNGFLGIPLCLLVFGEMSLPFSGVSVILTACCLYSFGLIGMELARAQGHGPLRALGKAGLAVITNPMIVAPILGAVASTFRFTPPEGIQTLLTLLAAAAIPVALVALGIFLQDNVRGGFKDLTWAPLTFAKLFVQPAIAWIIAGPILKAPTDVVHLAILLAMMPTGAGPFMLAQVYGRRGAVASQTILATTVLSIVTISLFLTFIR